jgi:hypothetical protein
MYQLFIVKNKIILKYAVKIGVDRFCFYLTNDLVCVGAAVGMRCSR